MWRWWPPRRPRATGSGSTLAVPAPRDGDGEAEEGATVADADGEPDADADSSPPPSTNNTRPPATAAGADGPSARGARPRSIARREVDGDDLLPPDDDRERPGQDRGRDPADVCRITDAGRRAPCGSVRGGRGRGRQAGATGVPLELRPRVGSTSPRTRAPPRTWPRGRRAKRATEGYARLVILPVAARRRRSVERREPDHRGDRRRLRDTRADRRRHRRPAHRNGGAGPAGRHDPNPSWRRAVREPRDRPCGRGPTVSHEHVLVTPPP